MSAVQARLNGVLGRTSLYEAFLGVRLFSVIHTIHIPMQEFIENIQYILQPSALEPYCYSPFFGTSIQIRIFNSYLNECTILVVVKILGFGKQDL
jgi:hypothetical protein